MTLRAISRCDFASGYSKVPPTESVTTYAATESAAAKSMTDQAV
jgi:hypothetical protein